MEADLKTGEVEGAEQDVTLPPAGTLKKAVSLEKSLEYVDLDSSYIFTLE